MRELSSASLRRRSCIVQEHDVGFDVGAHDAQGLAVERELKVLDRIRRKIRDLAAGGAIEWVEPEVVRGVCADGIHDGFPVGRELQKTVNTWIGIKEMHLRLGSGLERD